MTTASEVEDFTLTYYDAMQKKRFSFDMTTLEGKVEFEAEDESLN